MTMSAVETSKELARILSLADTDVAAALEAVDGVYSFGNKGVKADKLLLMLEKMAEKFSPGSPESNMVAKRISQIGLIDLSIENAKLAIDILSRIGSSEAVAVIPTVGIIFSNSYALDALEKIGTEASIKAMRDIDKSGADLSLVKIDKLLNLKEKFNDAADAGIQTEIDNQLGSLVDMIVEPDALVERIMDFDDQKVQDLRDILANVVNVISAKPVDHILDMALEVRASRNVLNKAYDERSPGYL